MVLVADERQRDRERVRGRIGAVDADADPTAARRGGGGRRQLDQVAATRAPCRLVDRLELRVLDLAVLRVRVEQRFIEIGAHLPARVLLVKPLGPRRGGRP